MGGKVPITIITNQYATMKAAIKLVLPGAIHRNCLFHVVRKTELKCGQTFANKDPELALNFYDIIYNSLTTKEFEDLWKYMLDKYGVGHLKYLQHMFNTREMYIPVYFKTQFLPFIPTTSRSEGTNAIFKDNVGPTTTAPTFVEEYDRIKKTQEEQCKEQDKNKTQDAPVLHSEYYFER